MFFKEKLNLKVLTNVLIKSKDTKTVNKFISLAFLNLTYDVVNGINKIEKITKTGTLI
jgi:hypothetical protein